MMPYMVGYQIGYGTTWFSIHSSTYSLYSIKGLTVIKSIHGVTPDIVGHIW